MISAFLSAFVFAYSTLVPVINPFSGAMFFTTMTRDVPDRDKGYVCRQIAIFCLIIMLVCLFAGHFILSFFGISVGALRVAGGCVLFPAHDGSEDQGQPQRIYSRTQLKSMAFYPFTLPLTTGPGCIAVTVAIGTSLPYDIPNIAGTVAAIIATMATIWVCYRYSDRISKAVGTAGADALARIMAFILICLGVSVFWQGFSELWKTL